MDGSASTHDRGQFLRLFLTAERDILRYLSAILPHPQDARDVLQETALALWEEFDAYDATRPFLPWAIGYARSCSSACESWRPSPAPADDFSFPLTLPTPDLARP